MTPKWHRRTADALRAAVDRADTWINGPDDEPATLLLTGENWLTQADDYHDAHLDITEPGVKVSPNILHEPPPPPEHNCTALDICRELQAIENLRHEAAHLRSFADELASR